MDGNQRHHFLYSTRRNATESTKPLQPKHNGQNLTGLVKSLQENWECLLNTCQIYDNIYAYIQMYNIGVVLVVSDVSDKITCSQCVYRLKLPH